MFGALGCVFSPNKISARAPARPRAIPTPLIKVMRSFKNTPDNTSNKTGATVITTLLLIGVDRLRPLKNIVMFNTMPKKAHAIMRIQSLVCMVSFL